MITYAVENNNKMFMYALNNALLYHPKSLVGMIGYFVELSDLSLWRSDIKYWETAVLKTMEMYRAEPAMYSAYREKFQSCVNIFNPSLLEIAVNSQHVSFVELLLAQEKRGIINFSTEAGLSPLHDAVKISCTMSMCISGAIPIGLTSTQLELIKSNSTQDNVDKSVAIVELLCKHSKVDINEFNDVGNTALFNAVVFRNTAMVKLLLHYKADPTVRGYGRRSPHTVGSSEEIQALLNEEVSRRIRENLSNKWEGFKRAISDWLQ
jgi:hypothetical protein